MRRCGSGRVGTSRTTFPGRRLNGEKCTELMFAGVAEVVEVDGLGLVVLGRALLSEWKGGYRKLESAKVLG